jgi:hypothetical protein
MPEIQSALSTVAARSTALIHSEGFRAVVIFDQLDPALTILELEAAALVDLVRPQLEGWELGNRSARRERPSFYADYRDLDCSVPARAARANGAARDAAAENLRNSRRRIARGMGILLRTVWAP